MCPTNPQKDLRSRKGNEPLSGTSLGMEFLGSIDARKPSREPTRNALRLTTYGGKLNAFCSMLFYGHATRNTVKSLIGTQTRQLKGEGD